MIRRCVPLILLGLVALPAMGQVVTTIRFDYVPPVLCDEVWIQDGVAMHFTGTTAEDYVPGFCFYDYSPFPGVWLEPCRLVADFGAALAVDRVEVDVYSSNGLGHTRAFLYADGVQVAYDANEVETGNETLVLEPALGRADMLAISAGIGRVFEIRISADVVPLDTGTWSGVKARYR